MDRSMQAKKAAVEQRISELDARREALYEEMETVKHQRSRAIEELANIDRAIKFATPTEGGDVRAVARRLKSFTTQELISALGGVPLARAKNHIQRLLDAEVIEQEKRKVMGKTIYTYKPPTDAGRAFERQQQRRQEEAELVQFVRSGPVAGTGSTLSQISDAEVRKAVREAVADGWSLERIGGTHFRLVRGKRRVTVPSTPRNSDNAARTIRHHTRRGGGRPRAGAAA